MEVYEILMEIFPQVDERILKAVAIENSNDPSAAVTEILTVIIPFMSGDSEGPSDRVEHEKERDSTRHEVGPSGSVSVDTEGSKNITTNNGSFPANTTYLDEERNRDVLSNSNHANAEPCVNADSSTTQESSTEPGLDNVGPIKSYSLTHEDEGNDDYEQLVVTSENIEPISLEFEVGAEQQTTPVMRLKLNPGTEVDGSSNDFNTIPRQRCNDVEPWLDDTLLEMEDFDAELIPPFLQIPYVPKFDSQKLCGSSSLNPSSIDEMTGIEYELTMNSIATRSDQLCRVDDLEEIIEEAKNNKKMLFSATESVINMMREVELKEKSVKEAEEGAAEGGKEILAKVEELKQMLACENEANGMVVEILMKDVGYIITDYVSKAEPVFVLLKHAGEVYGEKAILATELGELQSRLLSLADERDKSLSILDEMHQILEERLSAAEELTKTAEEEKIEKEKYAQIALTEQEALMEKIVQESKILKQEEEENSKLRDFLVDRGHVVDILHGEISVIFQDVRLLKEKLEERIPLSKSLSSSQTSCILASSSLSIKGTADVSSSAWKVQEEEQKRDSRRALSDEGWDVFEKDAELDG